MKNLISFSILCVCFLFFSTVGNAACPKNQILKDDHCVMKAHAKKAAARDLPAKTAGARDLPAKARAKDLPAKAKVGKSEKGIGIGVGRVQENTKEEPSMGSVGSDQPAKVGSKKWEPAPSGVETPLPANANQGTTAPNTGKSGTRIQ